MAPRRLQDGPKTALKGIFSLLKIDFDFELFWDRFWLHFGSPNASLWAPFWRSKSIKKSIRNRTAQNVAPRSPQDRPRPPQDAPRTPQEPPRCPPGPPGRPKMPSRTPLDGPKGFSEAPGPRLFSEEALCTTVVGKIGKFEIVENKSKKKSTTVIRGGHSTQSRTKVERTFTTVGPPEGGGGGRAKRSSIRRPQRSTESVL